MESWYRDASDEVKDLVYGKYAYFDQESGIPYVSATPELELFDRLLTRVGAVLDRRHALSDEPDLALREPLTMLAAVAGPAATLLPETSFVEVQLRVGGERYFTIIRDSAHTNVAELFREDARRRPTEDSLRALPGFVGTYPNALFSVVQDDLPAFVAAVGALDGDAAYDALRERFGVRRTDGRFWAFSDRAHAAFRQLEPLESGVFDYNRLDGR